MKNAIAFALFFTVFSIQAQKKWTLQECVDYAAKNNLQIIQSNQNKSIREKTLEASKKEKLPGVSANFNNNVSFGQGQDVFGNNQRNDNFNNSANIGANVLVFNNGRLEKQVKRDLFEVEASQFDVEKIRNDISLSIAEQYLNILLSKEVLKINQSAHENAKKQYERAKITTEVGTTAQTVLAEAEAAVAREYQNIKTSETNTKNALLNLAILLQLEDFRNFDVADAPYVDQLEPNYISANDVLTKAYANQPHIKAAEARIKAAEAQTTVTETNFYPTVSANAGIGTFYFNSLNTGKESNFFNQYKDNFGQQVGVSANIPIFNKGITKLQVEQAKINEDIAKTNLALQKQDVLQNVQRAEYSAENNYEIYKAAVQSEKSSKLALDFAEKRYQAGRSSIYDLNVARNNYANAQGAAAQAKYNYLFQTKVLEFYAGIPLSL